jgi:hypothetical protein
MNRASRPLPGAAAALLLSIALLTGAFAASAVAAVHYTKESQQEYAKQLAAGEIQAATINRKVRSIRLTLKDGRHVLVTYAKKQSRPEEARLKAKHVPVTVLAETAANKELKEKPKKHKIRYIVGGVVILVIVIAGGVLLINRRRRRDY